MISSYRERRQLHSPKPRKPPCAANSGHRFETRPAGTHLLAKSGALGRNTQDISRGRALLIQGAIVRLADIQRLPDLLAQGSLGQLVTSNKLDTFLKDSMSEEVPRKLGLAWPDRLVRESEIRESEETHS